jgi:3'-phosphoadenosine 5'-phosphosulfate sulfotransferase (PAPS reductase)/FAD synthetase
MIDYVLCVSWGNDSVAMIQLALEMQLENVAILYNDTGWADAS